MTIPDFTFTGLEHFVTPLSGLRITFLKHDSVVSDFRPCHERRAMNPVFFLLLLNLFNLNATAMEDVLDPVGGDGERGQFSFEILNTEGKAVPSRLTFRKPDGSRMKFFRNTQVNPADLAIRDDVICTISGKGLITLPAGTWVIYASRGPEWSIHKQEVVISSDTRTETTFELEHQVDTQGWAAADYHLHTLTYSGHGDSNMPERIISIASEALEVGIATDHNHHTDYAPTIEELSAGEHFQGIVGNEISVPLGHFNAFPLEPWGEVIDPGSENGPRMFRAVRAMRSQPDTGIGEVPVIQVNHPRWEAIDYFRIAGLDPITGSSTDPDWSVDFDSVEIFNENAGWGYYDAEITARPTGSSRHSVLEDWHLLLNHGARITAVGNSDSHAVNTNLAGWPRNYFPTSNDQPGKIPIKEICDTVKNGQVVTTFGPFVTFTVNGAGMGETVTAERAAVQLTTTIQAADWIDVDRVLVIVDGDVVETIPVPDSREIVRLVDTRKIPVRTDGWISLRVEGDESLAPIVPDKVRPVLPIAITNPVYIDADGDGIATAPVEVARRWLESHGNDSMRLHAEWQARQPRQRVALLNACLDDSIHSRTLSLWGLEDPSRVVRLAACRLIERAEITADESLLNALRSQLSTPELDPWATVVMLRALPLEESGPIIAKLLGDKGKAALGVHTREVTSLLPGQFVRRMKVSNPIPGGGKEGLTRVLGLPLEERPTANVLLSTEEGLFDLRQYGREKGRSDDCVVAMQCSLLSPDDRSVTLALGSDDGCLVQVNGETIVEDYAEQGVDPLDHLIQVNLKKGANPVLFLVENGGGGFGASLRILDNEVVVEATSGGSEPGNSLRVQILSDLAALLSAAQLYRIDEQVWPSSPEALLDRYITSKNLVRDPWGKNYIIASDSNGIEIICLGADGEEGGIGINADIVYRP